MDIKARISSFPYGLIDTDSKVWIEQFQSKASILVRNELINQFISSERILLPREKWFQIIIYVCILTVVFFYQHHHNKYSHQTVSGFINVTGSKMCYNKKKWNVNGKISVNVKWWMIYLLVAVCFCSCCCCCCCVWPTLVIVLSNYKNSPSIQCYSHLLLKVLRNNHETDFIY